MKKPYKIEMEKLPEGALPVYDKTRERCLFFNEKGINVYYPEGDERILLPFVRVTSFGKVKAIKSMSNTEALQAIAFQICQMVSALKNGYSFQNELNPVIKLALKTPITKDSNSPDHYVDIAIGSLGPFQYSEKIKNMTDEELTETIANFIIA